MKSSAIGLSCFSLLLATTTLARAATRFEPLRLVSAVDRTVAPWATPNGDSFGMQLAPDGAWVLFVSDASDVTTNLHQDLTLELYLYERTTRKTTLISMDPAGAEGGDAHTTVGRATPDGRLVTFESDARNLVPGVDTNYSSDVFVRDLTAGTTRLVSINLQGTEPGLGGSVDPVITPDGRYVAFTSTAEDLVQGDTNGLADVFVRDLLEESTERISVGSASPIFDPGYFYGSGGPRLSADGRWVAFSSTATNMVPGVTNLYGEIYVRDRLQGTTVCPTTVRPFQIVDIDKDGMADDWETNYFTNLDALPDADPDLDGFPNLAEYTAGTNPRDPLSHLRIEMAADESNHVRLHWAAAPGRTYVVESTLDLMGGEWTATPGVVRVAGAIAQFEAAEPRDAPAHYYRLRITNDTGP